MSGEVAHQDAPKEAKAARDHQQPKADQVAPGGGALLFAGGAPMFSVGQVAGLQRRAGNASMARVLQPPRPRPAPVVARQDKDDRAAKLSHGWMAASLKELAALPAAELVKVEAHAKDPDVAVERFDIMLTAVRLNKAGGAKDWQIRTIYQQMQAASTPQDQQQEVATFIGAFGLFTPKAINEYVKDVGDIFANWADLGSAEQRAQAFGYLINRQLGYQRVPPVKIVVATMASGGEFSKEDWTVTISTRLGALDLTPEQQSDLIRRAAANFLHEARHAEQIFTVARAQAGAGRLEAAIAKDLKIPADIAGKAAGLKIAPGTPEAKAAGDWYESEFGAGKAHRDAVLGDLEKRNEEYKALPEEADAHALGTAVSDRIQGGVPAPPAATSGDGGLPGGVQRQVAVQRCGPEHPDCGCEPDQAVQRSPAAVPVVQRDDKAEALVKATLLARGTTISNEDVVALVGQFPKGEITLSPVQLTLYGRSATAAAAAKMPAIQILGLNYSPKSVTYVFETGSGRGILVVGEGGASRLFDAGAVVGRLSAGLDFLVQSGLAKTPGVIKISHTDADHVTDLQAVVDGSGMPKPLVEITKQQLADPGMKAFARSRLNAVRPQVLEIDVSGEGMHVHREVSGALTYTDFRWAPAHAGLAGGGSKRTTNAGSPVSVVRDLLTGEVRVYTADSEPSTVMKMFGYIHPSAMPYIFGAGQLKEFELPHHGGANTETRKTEAGQNYIRMLRLAYEASDGTTTFFAQTEAEKSEQATNHVRVLHAAGFPVEKVVGFGPGATKIEGGVPQGIRLSAEEQAEVKARVQPMESTLMSARKTGASVGQLRTALQIQLDAAATESPAVRKGIADTLQKLDAEDKARVEAVNGWWTALESAIVASGGFNAKTDVSGCKAALEKLKQTGVMSPEKLLEYERTVQFQSEMMSASGRVAELALGMCDALLKKDVPRLGQLKALQGEAYRQAVVTLGSAQVEQTLREAWKAEAANLQKIQGQLLEMGQAAAKAETENRLTAASMGALANQMRAQEMVNKASEGHGGIPRTSSGAINQRARAGAGAMAALEVVRITLEIWHNIELGIAAAKARAVKRELRGWNKMRWWQDKGAAPQVEIVDDSDKPLSPRLTDLSLIYKVLAGEKIEGYDVPEHPRIVITSLSKADQMQAAMNLFLTANNLNEWHRVLNDARGQQDEQNRPPIAVDDTARQWAAYVWDFSKKDYVQQVDAEASAFIDQVYKTCFDNSDAELKQAAAAPGQGQLGTVKPTGWFSKTRDVYVYAQRGGIHKYAFPFEPRLTFPKTLPSGGQVRAKAADAQTYDYLRQFLWIVERNRAQAAGTRTGVEYEPNDQGLCYIDVGDVENVPPPANAPPPAP